MAGRGQRLGIQRARDDFAPACGTFKNFLGAGQSSRREQRRFNAAPGDHGLGGGLHHRYIAALRLRECVVVAGGYGDGVGGDVDVIRQQSRGQRSAGKLCMRACMPAALRHAGEIAQAQLHFVRDNHCLDQLAPAAPRVLRHRHRRREVAARVCGIAAEVIIIAVEITHQRAIHQRRQGTRGSFRGTDLRAARRCAQFARHAAHHARGRAMTGAKGARQRIQHDAFDLVDDLRRQIGVTNAMHHARQATP